MRFTISKEEWENAREVLYGEWDREPTDDEIRNYISGYYDYLYEMVHDATLEHQYEMAEEKKVLEKGNDDEGEY